MKTVFLDFDSLHPSDLDLSILQEQLDDHATWADSCIADIPDRLRGADVAVINKLHFSATLIEQLPNLKLICLAATGTDNVDLSAAGERGIAVSNIRAYCTPSVVQHVFALTLSLTQHLNEYQASVANGAWQKSGQFCLLEPPIRELQGKTLGLIGLGELGSSVAGVARAFGMRVIGARLPWNSTLSTSEAGQSVPRLPFHELLQQADVVSLHCPLTDDTRNLIDAAALDLMKRDALLINTARGGLVDSAALLSALQQEEIGGAGIDVLTEEPPNQNEPLLMAQLPNLIVTPHIAWSAREARQRALEEIVANIAAFKKGEERNRVC